MVPSWAVLTLKDLNTEENMITEMANTVYRNWYVIGGVGAKRYGIADSRGLTMARFDCGSIDFWIQQQDEILYPPLIGKDGPQLQLVSSEDQVYEWTTYSGPIEFSRLIYHVERHDMELVYNEISLRNHGLEKAIFTFYVVIRPMSVLGVEPLELIEYDASNKEVYVNRLLALMFDSSPTHISFCEANDSELPNKIRELTNDQERTMKSSAGQASIILRFDVTLRPAGSQQIFFASPLASIAKEDKPVFFVPSSNDRDTTVGNWFDFSDRRSKATFPMEQLDNVYAQATASLAMQAFPVIFPEEAHFASLSWKSRMRIFSALLRSGCNNVVEKIVHYIFDSVGISDGPLELSIYGPMLWGLLQHQQYSPKRLLTEGRVQTLTRLVLGFIESLNRQIGVIDSSGDDEDLLQHHIVISERVLEDFEQILWNLSTLRAAQSVFSERDETLNSTLLHTIEQYEEYVKKQIIEIEGARWPRSPGSMTEAIEDQILSILANTALFQNIEVDLAFLDRLFTRVSNKRIVNNLWKSFTPVETYSSHLALRLGHYFTLTQQRDRIEPILRRALEFLSEDYLLPEFVNTRSYGGAGGASSSVLASADLILLLRDMIIREDNSSLVFLDGVPDDWFTAKRPLIIDDLPTRIGPAHIEIGSSANQHQIETILVDYPDEIEFHLPTTVPMSMVKGYGCSIVERSSKTRSPFLRVIPMSDEIVLTYHK